MNRLSRILNRFPDWFWIAIAVCMWPFAKAFGWCDHEVNDKF